MVSILFRRDHSQPHVAIQSNDGQLWKNMLQGCPKPKTINQPTDCVSKCAWVNTASSPLDGLMIVGHVSCIHALRIMSHLANLQFT